MDFDIIEEIDIKKISNIYDDAILNENKIANCACRAYFFNQCSGWPWSGYTVAPCGSYSYHLLANVSSQEECNSACSQASSDDFNLYTVGTSSCTKVSNTGINGQGLFTDGEQRCLIRHGEENTCSNVLWTTYSHSCATSDWTRNWT